jgi:uncharacterized membrane protein YdjX (TVP38/TMEM64 family)
MSVKNWVVNHKRESFHYVIAFILLVTLSFFLVKRGGFYIGKLVTYSEKHLGITTAIILSLFALKSVSFGLPYALLYFTVGTIYPLHIALILNVVGIVINIQIPYFLGRNKGNTYVDSMVIKFPFLSKILILKDRSQFIFTFVVKLIGKIPHEITNLMLGSLHIAWPTYVLASILALLPTMVSTTLMAKNYQEPSSPIFIISLIIFIATPLLTFIYYYKNRDSSKEGE